jgi:hypothetical protein
MIPRPDVERSTNRALRALGLAAFAGLASVSFFACSGPKDGELFPGTFPSADMFQPVSAALEMRCGTLDCHGSFSRNLRVYGKNGIRAGKDISGVQNTTEDEVQLNYDSVVSIEPEKFSNIVAHAGQGFDKWIMITKGTGAEHHKGASRFVKGDPTYVCLLSWVTGALNIDACTQSVATVVQPGQPPPSTDDPSASGQPPDGPPPQP